MPKMSNQKSNSDFLFLMNKNRQSKNDENIIFRTAHQLSFSSN